MTLVLIRKVVAMASSTGLGTVGGVFTPTLFCGTALGLLYGTGIHVLLPDAVPVPVSHAMVGMDALLATTTHTPPMSILMIFGITLSYQVVLPLMLACITGYVTAYTTGAPSVHARVLARNRQGAGNDAQHLRAPSDDTQKQVRFANRDCMLEIFRDGKFAVLAPHRRRCDATNVETIGSAQRPE